MPSINQVRESRLLSNLSTKYKSEGHLHDKIFPMVPVKMKAGNFRVYERSWRLPETNRADGGLARQHSFDVSQSSYSLERHALKDYITEDIRDNYMVGSPESDVTEELTDKINLRKEKAFADLMTSTSWSQAQSLAAAGQWSLDTTTSNPILQIDSATGIVLLNAGVKPNLMAIREDARKAAKNHSSVIERVKYTQRDIDNGVLSALFSVPNLLVAEAAYDSSAKGATSVISHIWGDKCFLGFKPARPGLKVVSSGYMFQKNGSNRVKTWIDQERDDAMAVEATSQYQFRVVSSLTGYLISDLLG